MFVLLLLLERAACARCKFYSVTQEYKNGKRSQQRSHCKSLPAGWRAASSHVSAGTPSWCESPRVCGQGRPLCLAPARFPMMCPMSRTARSGSSVGHSEGAPCIFGVRLDLLLGSGSGRAHDPHLVSSFFRAFSPVLLLPCRGSFLLLHPKRTSSQAIVFRNKSQAPEKRVIANNVCPLPASRPSPEVGEDKGSLQKTKQTSHGFTLPWNPPKSNHAGVL